MPMVSTSPNSEMLFKLKFMAAMTAKVPMIETGTSIIGKIMAFQSWRKISTTKPTSATASNIVITTSWTDSRI